MTIPVCLKQVPRKNIYAGRAALDAAFIQKRYDENQFFNFA